MTRFTLLLLNEEVQEVVEPTFVPSFKSNYNDSIDDNDRLLKVRSSGFDSRYGTNEENDNDDDNTTNSSSSCTSLSDEDDIDTPADAISTTTPTTTSINRFGIGTTRYTLQHNTESMEQYKHRWGYRNTFHHPYKDHTTINFTDHDDTDDSYNNQQQQPVNQHLKNKMKQPSRFHRLAGSIHSNHNDRMPSTRILVQYATKHFQPTTDEAITTNMTRHKKYRYDPMKRLQQNQSQNQQQQRNQNNHHHDHDPRSALSSSRTLHSGIVPTTLDNERSTFTEVDDDMDRLSYLLRTAVQIENQSDHHPTTTTTTTTTTDTDAIYGLLQLHKLIRHDDVTFKKMDHQTDILNQQYHLKLQQKYKNEHEQTKVAFSKLIQKQQQQYDTQQQQQQEEYERQQQQQQQEEEQETNRLLQLQLLQQQQQQQEEDEEAKRKQQEQDEEEAAAAIATLRDDEKEEEKKKIELEPIPSVPSQHQQHQPEYVREANQMMDRLRTIQFQVVPFETNSLVSKRRLLYKKTVNGKVNTLAENVMKIQQVANEVIHIITNSKIDDEQQQQQDQQQQQQQLQKMGTHYLLDLLCSKVMLRVQAEGFNGQRGDGFPISAMLTHIAIHHTEIIPILAAHIYFVCPTAIPTLPEISPDAPEEEFMKALGMLQIKKKDSTTTSNNNNTNNGDAIEFESFERFLSRTEGVISLVATIMSSQPSSHLLLGGHLGAIEWLQRFIALLPPPPQSPLPLVTAPVLDAFLRGAGHMLAIHHGDEFRVILDTIQNDIMNRLDVSSIGMPPSTRLKKTIENGFGGFQNTLPSRAMAELYYGKEAGYTNYNNGGQVFSNQNTSSTTNSKHSPFGNFQNSSATNKSSPFGTSNNNNPFGSQPSTSSGFGASLSSASPSPFGNGMASTSGGGKPPIAPTFGSSGTSFNTKPNLGGESAMNTTTPFGNTSFGNGNNSGGTNTSPFSSGTNMPTSTNSSMMGNQTTTNPSPFGNPSGSNSFGGTATPFGTNTTATGPFGDGNSSSSHSFGGGAAFTTTSTFGAPSPSPFGATASNPAPFGGGLSSTNSVVPFGSAPSVSNPSTFGINASAPSPSPFGGVSSAPNPSPFGGASSIPNASPFGGVPSSSSPFGGGGSAAVSNPSPFGGGNMALNPSSFGGGGSSSAPSPSPFGGANVSSTPFGGVSSPSPFSQQPVGSQNQQPFQNNSFAPAPSPFGTASVNPSPFGASSSTTSNPSPFGGTSSTFSANNNNASPFTSFGGQQQQQQNKSNRPPCKFFAQGRCNKGDQCPFSHETPQSSQNNFSSPFGGPRR